MRRVADRGLVGVINAGEPVMGVFRSAYLGYYAFAGSERQGLMTEGLALVLDAAFGSLGFHRLEANIQPANRRLAGAGEAAGISPGRLLAALPED